MKDWKEGFLLGIMITTLIFMLVAMVVEAIINNETDDGQDTELLTVDWVQIEPPPGWEECWRGWIGGQIIAACR